MTHTVPHKRLKRPDVPPLEHILKRLSLLHGHDVWYAHTDHAHEYNRKCHVQHHRPQSVKTILAVQGECFYRRKRHEQYFPHIRKRAETDPMHQHISFFFDFRHSRIIPVANEMKGDVGWNNP